MSSGRRDRKRARRDAGKGGPLRTVEAVQAYAQRAYLDAIARADKRRAELGLTVDEWPTVALALSVTELEALLDGPLARPRFWRSRVPAKLQPLLDELAGARRAIAAQQARPELELVDDDGGVA